VWRDQRKGFSILPNGKPYIFEDDSINLACPLNNVRHILPSTYREDIHYHWTGALGTPVWLSAVRLLAVRLSAVRLPSVMLYAVGCELIAYKLWRAAVVLWL
jgi:hypothetical protein